MTFRAVRADKTEAGQVVKFVEMDESKLMDGDVTIGVTHSTVNYKDGLTLSGKSPVIRRFPMVCSASISRESSLARSAPRYRTARSLWLISIRPGVKQYCEAPFE
jgi:hypothetical protein